MHPPLSLTGKQWNTPKRTDFNPSAIVARLRAERGLDRAAPPLSPTVFPDLPRALERIRIAQERGEGIGIFGDYDCDGITGTALLVRHFRRRGIAHQVILPHRVHDGYGLKSSIVDRFAERGVTLLITVDTGITAVAEVEEARRRGIDVIITDHHHIPQELPRACAILHPALAPGFSPPHPSGAGVAFLLVTALEGGSWPESDTDCALAAIGTIADLVELTGSNRALVIHGLQALNRLTSSPLAVLADGIRSNGLPLTSTDIAFRLAPRINAAGRMEDPTIALTALLDGGPALESLEQLNGDRQLSMQNIFEEVLTALTLPLQPTQEDLHRLPPLLTVARESFSEGLIGLAAGKLTEMTGRPSMVAAIRGNECTASLRSTGAYNIAEGLERCAELFTTFGGHARAAGCTFPYAHWEVIQDRLQADVRKYASGESLLPSLEVTATLQPGDLSLAFCEHLQGLEPFGQGNTEPLFLLPNIRMEQARRVGNEGAHLQARIGGVKAIGWRLGHLLPHAVSALDMACKLSIDTWNGRRAPQLVIEDLRVCVGQVNSSIPSDGTKYAVHST